MSAHAAMCYSIDLLGRVLLLKAEHRRVQRPGEAEQVLQEVSDKKQNVPEDDGAPPELPVHLCVGGGGCTGSIIPFHLQGSRRAISSGTDLPDDDGKEHDVEELRPQDRRQLEESVHGPDAAVVMPLGAGPPPSLLLPDAKHALEPGHDAETALGDDPRVQIPRGRGDPPGRHEGIVRAPCLSD